MKEVICRTANVFDYAHLICARTRITVELVDDDGICNVNHLHILESHVSNIPRATLLTRKGLYRIRVTVPCRAVSNTTFETISVSLSFPKLPMLFIHNLSIIIQESTLNVLHPDV